MAETAARRSAVHDLAAALEAGSSAAVRLAERPARTQLDLRLDAANLDARGAAEAVLGLALPLVPNRSAASGQIAALWLGPNEWLVTGPDDGQLSSALEAALDGRRAALTDVSAMRTVLALTGEAARAVLMKGCRLDLHPRVFGAGQCVQTELAQAVVILHQIDDAPCYEISVRNSFAVYLATWLLDAMAEFGTGT